MYPNYWDHSFKDLGPVLHKLSVSQKYRDTTIVGLIAEMGTKWLRVRQWTQCGYAGKMVDSHPGGVAMVQDFIMLHVMVCKLELINCVILGFSTIFSNCI